MSVCSFLFVCTGCLSYREAGGLLTCICLLHSVCLYWMLVNSPQLCKYKGYVWVTSVLWAMQASETCLACMLAEGSLLIELHAKE